MRMRESTDDCYSTFFLNCTHIFMIVTAMIGCMFANVDNDDGCIIKDALQMPCFAGMSVEEVANDLAEECVVGVPIEHRTAA